MHYCGSSLVDPFNPTKGLSHTRSSSGHLACDPASIKKVWSIITQALLRIVQLSTASCLVINKTPAIRIMMFILKVISRFSNAKNNACQSEEASELAYTGLFYSLSSQKCISMTFGVTH